MERVTLGNQFLFSVADTGHFGVGVDNSWNRIVIDVGLLSSNILSHEDALLFSLVGKHSTAHHISNRQNTGDVGLKVVVHDDSAPLVHFHTCPLEAQLISVRSAPSGNQNMVCLEHQLLSALHWLNSDLSVCAVILA